MKKLLLFVMLTGFLAVNAQHASQDFKSASIHYNYANDVKSDIIPAGNWHLSKKIGPPVEEREITSDIVPAGDWHLSKKIGPPVEEREINSDIIPAGNWHLSIKIAPPVEHR